MNRYRHLPFCILGLIASVLAIASSFPSFRQTAREFFIKSDRIILAKADGSLTKDVSVTVLKVKTPDTISLEIYSRKADTNDLTFMKRIILPEKRDGYFTFRGNATNLVLTDLDGDGNLEILTSTFDENLIPRLHVYKYEPETQLFLKMGTDSIKL